MGRAPCCDKANVKKGPWSPEEDRKLKDYIEKHGTGGNWITLPHKSGLKRCGKSCRLRWLNYLRPNIKHGDFSDDEDRVICNLFASIGSRWSIIAAQLPGRTDNDIKNYFNTKLKKKILGFPPPQRKTQQQRQQLFSSALENNTTPFSLTQGIEAIVHPITTTISSTNSLQRDPLHFQVKEQSSNLLMFGGEQSCSSSDGSCNLLSYGKDLGWEQLGSGSFYLFGGLELEETHKVIPTGSGTEASLEYKFDEIKEMVGPSIGCNGLYPDEPSSASFERQGRSMYYY